MRKVGFLPILALFVMMLGGCEQPVNSRIQNPVFSVSKVDESQDGCSCPSAVRYRIDNTGSADGRLAVTRLERLLNSSAVTSKDVTLSIPRGGNHQLDCSVQPDESNTCNRQVAYKVLGQHYPDTPADMARDAIINLVQDNLASSGALSPTGQCVSPCVNGDDQCELVDATNTPDAPLGRKIANLLGNLPENGNVPVEKILELTKTGENTCQRTDMATRNHYAYNYGNDNCVIKGVLPAGLGSADTHVPGNLMFNFDTGGNVGNFTMVFPRKKGAVELEFSNPVLNSAFGAHLARIDHVDGLFIGEFQAGNGAKNCFALKTH